VKLVFKEEVDGANMRQRNGSSCVADVVQGRQGARHSSEESSSTYHKVSE
jgi:hypothetical protein